MDNAWITCLTTKLIDQSKGAIKITSPISKKVHMHIQFKNYELYIVFFKFLYSTIKN